MIYNTPYDDAFRTLTVDCPRLLIPMMNEIFDKHYTGDEAVTLHPNEHFLIGQDGDEKKRITDSIFSIQGDRYLFECMAYSDNTLILRVFEYAIQDGLENSILNGNVLTVSIPEAAVLYLRGDQAPQGLSIQIVTKAGSLCFPIPTMRVSDYSIDDLFTRKLYFLIPFYIFAYEREFKSIEGNESALEKLKSDYRRLVSMLDNAVEHGQLSAYYRRTIRDMSTRVTNSIARRYDNIREGVNTVMGGQVLEHEGKRIYNEGRAEGIAEGIAEGEANGVMSEKEKTSIKLYRRGESVESIAEFVEVSSNLVKQWIESAAKQAQTV